MFGASKNYKFHKIGHIKKAFNSVEFGPNTKVLHEITYILDHAIAPNMAISF